MQKAFGICLISLLFMASGCATGAKHSGCACGDKAKMEMKKTECGCDKAGHNHASHDHEKCKDGDCALPKKSNN